METETEQKHEEIERRARNVNRALREAKGQTCVTWAMHLWMLIGRKGNVVHTHWTSSARCHNRERTLKLMNPSLSHKHDVAEGGSMQACHRLLAIERHGTGSR